MKIHIPETYLLHPTHPVTVSLIGVGGTGCRVLTALQLMHASLRALNHPGLQVWAFDPDIVTEANKGRQLYADTEIGLNKAEAYITRNNRFFGTDWMAVPHKFDGKHALPNNITISCVDTVKARLKTEVILKGFAKEKNRDSIPYDRPYYWMDFGNTRDSGQVAIGTLIEFEEKKSKHYEIINKLPLPTERFNFSEVKEKDSGPSCSQAEALKKQDLFINATLAQIGCDLLWKIFRERHIDRAGYFLNMKKGRMNPIPL